MHVPPGFSPGSLELTRPGRGFFLTWRRSSGATTPLWWSCGAVHLRVAAALSSQLLLCRTLGCSCSVHPTPTPFRFLCLGDYVSWVSGVAAL